MIEEHFVGANGLRFRCLTAGPRGGELVLMLHGFPEGAESWTSQLTALAEAGLRACAPDLRGYGGTDCPGDPAEYTMAALVEDVHSLIAALGAERAHLAGHDWGGLLGWVLVSQHPDRVLSWCALSVGHPAALAQARQEDEDQRRRSAYIGLFRRAGRAEEVLAADGFRRLREMYRLGPNPDAIPAEVIERYVQGFSRPGRLTAALNYYRTALPALAGASGEVTAPTLLLWGDRDPALGRLGVELTPRFVMGRATGCSSRLRTRCRV